MTNKLRVLLAFLFTVTVTQAQVTNTYSTPFHSNVVSQAFACDGLHKFKYWAELVWKPNGTNFQTTWYFPTSNTLSAHIDTNGIILEPISSFGMVPCGTNTVSWTDNNWTNALDGYRFQCFWPTNVPKPAEGTLIPLTTVNFRTNAF